MRRLVACTMLLGMLTACSGSSSDADTGFVAGDGSITIVDAADRKAAPILSGETIQGKPFSIERWAGKTVVVNAWGSWCADCRIETPDLIAIAADMHDQGVRVLGVTVRDNLDAARAYADQEGMTYPSIMDDDGSSLLAFSETLPASAVPTTWVIDSEGRLAARILGSTTETTLRDVVEDVDG